MIKNQLYIDCWFENIELILIFSSAFEVV